MPLVVLSGCPASGKSRRTQQLVDHLSTLDSEVCRKIVVVSDQTLLLERNEAYKNAYQEKFTRASLKAFVERELTRDKVLIADCMNYIKGFRYELYCVARANATTNCVIHCDTPLEKCREFNSSRPDGYSPELLEDLYGRFETPNPQQRWDRPCFTVRPDDELDLEGISKAILEGIVLTPNLATSQVVLSDTNMLHEIDRVTQEIIKALMAHQNSGLGAQFVIVPHCENKFEMPATPYTIGTLQRMKRQFIKIAELHPPGTVREIGPHFLQYLKGQAADVAG